MTSWVAAIIYLVALGFVWFLVPFLVRRHETRKLEDTCAHRNAIILTYDDGPGPTLTPRLLDLLKKHDVHATFYALGRNIDANPHLFQRTLAEGHEVGSHTYNHSNAWKTDPFTYASDTVRGIETTQRNGGSAFAFRPPYGKLTIWGLLHGYIRGLRYGWWTVDSRDSWDRRGIDDVLTEIARKKGGVVLMHDYDSYAKAPAGQSHPDYVIALTEAIINLAKSRGLRIVPRSSLEYD
jgi:peptidoglycan-N-acetylglucosamine deacetylase